MYIDFTNEDEQTIRYIDYNLSDCEFVYNFTKDTCHKILTGTCVLDEWKDRLSELSFGKKDFKKYPHCVSLYFCLLKKIRLSNFPWILRCKCGHYECTDGQHRTCIAKRMNILIDVEFFKDMSDYCLDCQKLKKVDTTTSFEKYELT